MSELVIRQIPVLKDNYVYLIHEPQSRATGVVDPSVAPPILEAAEREGWRITHILNTHHHNDHTGGNNEIKAATGCIIVGPRADRDRIPGIDIEVGDGDTYEFGAEKARVFDVPGHTRGHIAYHFAHSNALFCGDTLFIMGCGRVFEGTHAQMWNSLSKLKALPPETRVYCAHEYTQANARFALTVEPENRDLVERAAMVELDARQGSIDGARNARPRVQDQPLPARRSAGAAASGGIARRCGSDLCLDPHAQRQVLRIVPI